MAKVFLTMVELSLRFSIDRYVDLLMATKQSSPQASDQGIADIFLQGFIALLLLILVFLQYRLWAGEGSLAEAQTLKAKIAEQQKKNAQLATDNDRLMSQVASLKQGLDAIESRAREDLGMVKSDETFYLLVEQPAAQP